MQIYTQIKNMSNTIETILVSLQVKPMLFENMHLTTSLSLIKFDWTTSKAACKNALVCTSEGDAQ